MRVLLIEDDQSMSEVLDQILRRNSVVCDRAHTGQDGINLCKVHQYDVILLDMVLPDQSGTDIIRAIRASGIKTPIIILSGLTGTDEKVTCLNLGADCYMEKPFFQQELLARINAVSRRCSGNASSVINAGPLRVDLARKLIKVIKQDNTEVELNFTGKEYLILELMAQHPGAILPKSVFINYLYGCNEVPEPKIIDVFVCKIRNKLMEHIGMQTAKQCIRTHWGRGHSLVITPEKASAIKDQLSHHVKPALKYTA